MYCTVQAFVHALATRRFVGNYLKADSSNYAKVLAPIYGLVDLEPVTLSGALQQVCKLCEERDLAYPAKKFKVLSASVWAANSFVQSKWDKLLLNRYGSRGMTKDLAAFLNFYCQESPFYPEINRLLRDEVRGHLVPYFSWLRGFLSACYCLPLQPDNVLRGVKKNLKGGCWVGSTSQKITLRIWKGCIRGVRVRRSESHDHRCVYHAYMQT